MKNKKCVKKAVCLITALVAACCAAALSGCAPRATKELLPQGVRQEIDGGESLQKIDNPDQGFYRPIYVKVTTAGAIYNQNSITDETRLYHLRMDISAFSHAVNNESDMLLTDAALQGIGQLLATLREKDKTPSYVLPMRRRSANKRIKNPLCKPCCCISRKCATY